MKVRICQTKPELLNVEANLEAVISEIHHGQEEGADLVVFPELALTGYMVGQHYHEVALRMDSLEVARLAAATRGTAAVVGFIEESASMNFYNSALVMVDGEMLFAYRKLNLPNYGIFEERKIFSHGKRVRVFRLQDFNLAVFICNDLWHPSLPYLGVCQKADAFITVFNSADTSMGNEFSNIESWEIINKFYARVLGIYNICANRVGTETVTGISVDESLTEPRDASSGFDGSCHFWGGSEIINPFGQAIAEAALYEPDRIEATIERNLLRQKRILLPYLRNDDPYFTHRELSRILYGGDKASPGADTQTPGNPTPPLFGRSS